MVSIRNPVAHGAAPDGLTIAALGLMDNLGLYKNSLLESSFDHVDGLTVATLTPDSERWPHETKAASDLAPALV